MDFTVHHIGWITLDVNRFESFWCKVLGFQSISESKLSKQMSNVLFSGQDVALIRRYRKDGVTVELEIHQFNESDTLIVQQLFQRHGINHICLHTGERGSRQKLLDQLPLNIGRHIFDNPGGWQNIFIRDYEGNWIELRENL